MEIDPEPLSYEDNVVACRIFPYDNLLWRQRDLITSARAIWVYDWIADKWYNL